MTDLTKKLVEIFNTINFTNVRITATLVAMLLTTFTYIFSVYMHYRTGAEFWTPDSNWLLFLCGMGGIDAAQFTAKRMTFIPDSSTAAPASSNPSPEDVPVPQDDVTSTSDVSEYQSQKG